MKVFKKVADINSAAGLANYCFTQHFVNHRSIFGLRLNNFKDKDFVLETCQEVLKALTEENYTDEELEEFFIFGEMFSNGGKNE